MSDCEVSNQPAARHGAKPIVVLVLLMSWTLHSRTVQAQGVPSSPHLNLLLPLNEDLIFGSRPLLGFDGGAYLARDLTLSAADLLDPATTPPIVRGVDGPFEFSFAIDNDNLLFGLHSRIAGPRLDGNDLGRTHRTALSFRYDLDDEFFVTADLSSELYTRAIAQGPINYQGTTIPIYFNEVSELRLGTEYRPRHLPFRARFRVGIVVHNHEHLSFGAAGQQHLYHDLARQSFPTMWAFDHVPDGQHMQAGLTSDGAMGLHHVVVSDPLFRLSISGYGGTLLNTIWQGSAPYAEASVTMALGPENFQWIWRVENTFWFWMGSLSPGNRVSVSSRVSTEHFDLFFELHTYQLNSNPEYYTYVFNNVVMTTGLTGRL